MTRPAPRRKEPRFLALPVAPCERCGDAMIPGLAAPVCVPCQRRAEVRQRMGRQSEERTVLRRLFARWGTSAEGAALVAAARSRRGAS